MTTRGEFDKGFARAAESSSLSDDRIGWAFTADDLWVVRQALLCVNDQATGEVLARIDAALGLEEQ